MKTVSIPMPKGLPVLGHLFGLPGDRLTQHFTAIAKDFPGIFRLSFAGYPVTFVTDPDLVAELADPKRFRKLVGPPLSFLRDLAGDGLFTAHSHEPNWHCAHRILVPAFGQRAMRGYFDLMRPVADQLIDKWLQASKADQSVQVTEDMTRYTLETIGVCGFGYRFGLFDSQAMHPFTDAMWAVLREAMDRLTRLRIPSPVSWWQKCIYQRNVRYMHQLVDEVIAQRRSQEGSAAFYEAKDLLGLMLQTVDPQTGQRLSDENIRFQVITFLIAGHETTSGLLSFALYHLSSNPQVLARAQAEVDSVLPPTSTGAAVVTYDHLSELKVVDQVLKETLRLWPTAPVYSVAPFEDTIIGGQYAIRKNHRINILLTGVHRSAGDWQEPEVFDIERFAPERESQIRPFAYKPFGQGERACIGRQFAYAEARLALAMILQRFEIRPTLIID